MREFPISPKQVPVNVNSSAIRERSVCLQIDTEEENKYKAEVMIRTKGQRGKTQEIEQTGFPV